MKSPPKTKQPANKNQQLMDLLRDRTMSTADRGDMLIYNICEQGIDLRSTGHQLIEDADVGHEQQQKKEKEGQNALVSERLLGTVTRPLGHFYALISRGRGHVYLPAKPEDVEGVRIGERILVDMKEEKIAGPDGHLPDTGEVVSIDSAPPETPGQVIVNYEHRRRLARLHDDLLQRPEECQPGKEVLFDPVTDFAFAAIETGSDGEELLCKPEHIADVTRKDVGAPKPVVDEIVARFKQAVEHPDWNETMQVRQRCSYLFSGGTGSGKSFNLKLIANEIHDYVEERTGQRSSRLVIVDASQFWASLFGETEQRIARWAKKLESLGSRVLKDRDGKDVHFPVVVALEECESFLRSRGDMQGSGHLFDRPLSLFLQKTESLENALQVGIIWIATSNRPDLADSAALRRVGMRQVCFGSLRANEAMAVLKKKVPETMKIQRHSRGDGDPRESLLRRVIAYLYGPEPKQPLAEVRLGNSERRVLNRSDVVTPAVLEEAVSSAVDRCLRKSHLAGKLLGLDVADVIGNLHRHFCSLARTLRPHNLAEHATEWFERERPMVTDIVPLINDRRRPTALHVR